MANRVTTLRTHALLAGGSTLVTAFRLALWGEANDANLRITSLRVGIHTDDKTNGIRQTAFRVGIHANDKTNGVRTTTFRVHSWASLDQGLYFGELFGGSEVFEPDLFADPDFEIPEAPVIEVNPYRASVPNDDLQRIMREQHNVTQAGDSTFHWGVLTEISNEALYTLGSAGRFYHDTLGIIKARYCKFVDFERTSSRASPVGLRGPTIQPWVVTNQLDLSAANQAMGIAIPYNDQVFIGEWYGWVITEGYVPVELQVEVTAAQVEFGTEYGWQATGYVDSGLDVVSLGYRTKIGGNLRLPPGDFFVDTDRSSLGRVNGLVTARLAPLVSDLDQLTTDLTTLQGTVAGHTQQLATHTTDIAAVNSRLTREVTNLSNALSAIRSLMPDSNFKEYVDTSIENLKGYVDVNLTLANGVANAALLRANEAYSLAQSISYDAIQVQISALNDAMGGITDRIIGFKTTIDTNTLTAGQVLVSYLYDTDVDGVNYYDFRPLDLKFSSLFDVDVSTPPADGDVPIWDNAAQKWIPGPQSGGGGGGGGGGTYELLDDQVLGVAGSSVTFATINQDYDHLKIFMEIVSDGSSSDAQVNARFNNDSGGNYRSYLQNAFGSGTATTELNVGLVPVVGGIAFSEVDIYDYATAAARKQELFRSTTQAGTSFNQWGGGYWADTDPITEIDLFRTGGNWGIGSRFRLYGWKADAGGGGGSSTPWWFAPPLVADFTTAFGGAHGWATLADDADEGLLFDAGVPEAGDKTIYAYQAIPSPGSDWTCTMRISTSIPAQNFSSVGILCQNSSNSRIMLGSLASGGNAWFLKLFALNPGSYVGELNATWNGDPKWLRLVKTATHLQFWVSAEGKIWTMAMQDTLAAFIGTPDRIGFGVLHNRSSGPRVVGSIQYWDFQ